jgi:hypothetical protein
MSRALERRRPWQSPRFIEGEIDEERVREKLLAQHSRLRGMLASLDAKALAVIRGGACSSSDLSNTFAAIARALDDHTREEERSLGRLLPRTAEAARALAHLREAHRSEREELQSMSRLAARCDDGITLALAVRGMVIDVLLDIDAEDRRYLSERPFEGASTGADS